MIQFVKRLSLFSIVIAVSGFGIEIGRTLGHQTAEMRWAQAASTSGASTGQSDRYEYLELFNRVLHFVKENYVDEVKVKTLIEGAIKGMLETLDPHSNFL